MRSDAFSLQFSFTDNFFFILRQTAQAEMSLLLMLKKGARSDSWRIVFLFSQKSPLPPTNQPTNQPTIKVSQLSLLIQCFLRFCQLYESLILRTAVCMKYDVEE